MKFLYIKDNKKLFYNYFITNLPISIIHNINIKKQAYSKIINLICHY